jgi:HK97 family phage portal protein
LNLFGLEIRRAGTLTPVASNNRGGWWPFVREPFIGAWQRNAEIRTDSVLAHHAVYSCITRISQDIGKLRPKLVELDSDGIWTETTSPAFSGVLSQPNRFQNYIQFQEWWITSKLIHGNSYALLQRDGRGTVEALYLLDPTRVTVLVAPDGSVLYELKRDDLSEVGEAKDGVSVPASEIIHDRMNCLFHPLVGVSPIFACGTAANMGLSIETNSTSFFGNGSNPSGILTSPNPITAEKSAELSTIWNAQFGGSGSGGVAVLGNAMKFEAMKMTAVESQLIEQLGWTAEVICTTFHVPPFKVGIGTQPTYQNAEILNQIYYSDCLQSHIESYELSMDQGLGLRSKLAGGKTLGVELDLDGLLRMDTASQVTTLAAAVGGSLLKVNEARKKLDQKPTPGGDTIWMQQQNFSLEALAERDRNNPFAKAPSPEPTPNVQAITSGEPQKQLTAGDQAKEAKRSVAEPVEESDALEMWDGWFARDALTLVREAQELETRVVQEAIESQRSVESDRVQERFITAITALATRENPPTIVNVTPPQTVVNVAPAEVPATIVNVAPAQVPPTIVNVATPEVRVEPPSLQLTMETPKSGVRNLVISKPDGKTVTATVMDGPKSGTRTLLINKPNGETVSATVEES